MFWGDSSFDRAKRNWVVWALETCEKLFSAGVEIGRGLTGACQDGVAAGALARHPKSEMKGSVIDGVPRHCCWRSTLESFIVCIIFD